MEKQTEKKAKVLLMQPPYTIYKMDFKRCMPPLGLAYIAALLEQNDFDVKILDAYVEGFENEKDLGNGYVLVGLEAKDIYDSIADFNPDFVGISGMFSTQDKNVLKLCSLVKKFNPKIPVFVGGSHPTYYVKEALANNDIDFIIMGEGELTTLNLIQKLMNNEDISEIEGLGYKKDGEIFVNSKLNYIQDLDVLPNPARHLLNMDKYINLNLPQSPYTMKDRVTQVVTSRGCSARCTFCTTTNFWGNIYRVRSAKRVVDEIEMLINKYGIEEIHFCDDNFSLNRRRAHEIMDEIIRRDLKFVWCTPQGIAVWALDESLIEKFAKTGCYQLTFAIESGNQWVETKLMNKPLILSKVKPLVDKAHSLGIGIHGFFIVGMPGENKEQIMETFDFPIKNEFDSASFFIASPIPGSELYKIAKEKGFLKEGFNVNELTFKVGNIHTEEFTPEELENMVKINTESINRGLAARNPELYYKKYGKNGFNFEAKRGYFKVKDRSVNEQPAPPAEEKGCLFCQSDNIQSDILWESENFFVKVGIGILAPGHVMLIPKKHLSCFGELPMELSEEFLSLKEEIFSRVASNFSEPILFEHGNYSQSVKHAHIHFIPTKNHYYSLENFGEKIFKDIRSIPAQDILEIKRVFENEGSYFYLEENGHKRIFLTRGLPEGKYNLRKEFARLTGYYGLVKWQTISEEEKKKNEEWIKKTKEILQVAKTTD